jgi:alcohol dehydrogenase (NADP+)
VECDTNCLSVCTRHEIIGRVNKVGSAVTKFKPGDIATVGCLVDSDGSCPECQAGFEQYCQNMTLTYNSPDVHLGGVTYGGYSDSIVVKDHFVLRVPSNLDLAGAAPLLCAGITTYSPMRHWGVTKGKKVGVVGLGGLGHIAVKIAHALGAHVVVFTTALNKKKMHFASVQMRWLFREIPIRCASMKAALISFSMLFQLNTTLTHTYNYSAMMVT